MAELPEGFQLDNQVPEGFVLDDGQDVVVESSLRGFSSSERPRFGPSGFFEAARDVAVGTGETALTLGSGLAGSVLGGFSGLLSLGDGIDAAAQAVRETQQNLTYQPRTDVGRTMTETIGLPYQGADYLITEGAGMLPGGPVVQTAAKTAVEALPALAGRGRINRQPITRQQQILQESQNAGYVVPTSSANPTSIARGTVEGLAGKPRMQQQASYRNQQVTNKLAADELGLPPGTEITVEALEGLRNQAGRSYDVLNNAGTITATTSFRRDLAKSVSDLKKASKDFEVLTKADSPVSDAIAMAEGFNKPTFQASSVVTATKVLRDEASTAYRNGQANVGKAYRDMAKALEDAAERHLDLFGDPLAVQRFREARTQIAKSYSVEEALAGDGFVSAPKLAAQLDKGVPLSGNLLTIARFAENFPKSARVIKETPIQTGRLSAMLGAGGGMGLFAAGEPASAATLATLAFGGPIVRGALLSRLGQATLGKPQASLGNLSPATAGLITSDLLARSPEQR